MSDSPVTPATAAPHRDGAFEETWPLVDHRGNGPRGDGPRAGDAPADSSALKSAAHQLLARARRLSAGPEANRQLAVIYVIAACDLHTEQGLTRLMRRRRAGLQDIVALLGNSFNLGNLRAQRIYSELRDDHPWGDAARQRTAASWWADWSTTCALRHEVAHAGRAVSPDAAVRAIRCGVSYIAHVTDAVTRALRALP